MAVFMRKHLLFSKQLFAQLYSQVGLARSVTACFPQSSGIISDPCPDECMVSANNKWGEDMVRLTGPLFHLEAGWEQALEPRLGGLAGTGNFN